MSADRLAELRHQRALVQEQLVWLDREIAAQTAGQPVAAPPPAAPSLQSISPRAETPRKDAAVDAIMDDYRVPPAALHQDVRKGCFVYLAIAVIVLGAVTVGLYFALKRD